MTKHAQVYKLARKITLKQEYKKGDNNNGFNGFTET